jgi:predicted phage-related endonuclease
MKLHKFQNKEEWLNFRKGKISGTRLKDIIVKRGTGHKKGYYELIAERLSVTEEEFDGFIPNETPMDRGTRLQKFALERFRTETGKKVREDLIIWSSDDSDDITISPDGVISDTEAVETKCLSSASHIEAFLTNEVPDEYKDQGTQYFIVNEKLKKLHFVFYDPRIPAKDYFVIEIKRKDIEEEIKTYREFQIKTIAEVNDIVNKLLNF